MSRASELYNLKQDPNKTVYEMTVFRKITVHDYNTCTCEEVSRQYSFYKDQLEVLAEALRNADSSLIVEVTQVG